MVVNPWRWAQEQSRQCVDLSSEATWYTSIDMNYLAIFSMHFVYYSMLLGNLTSPLPHWHATFLCTSRAAPDTVEHCSCPCMSHLLTFVTYGSLVYPVTQA